MRSFLLAAAAAVASSAGGTARADVYLVGFDIYSSNANGSNAIPNYRYSSNTSDGSSTPLVTPTSPAGATQSKGISFHLVNGANTFNFAAASPFGPGPYAGVEFFFNTTGVSYNPGDNPHAGDLVVYAPTSGGSFQSPANGTAVLDYGPNGGNATYNGGSSATVGGLVVTDTAFNVNTTPSGSFTLNVSPTAVPEPSTVALAGAASLAFAVIGWARGRRKAAVA